MSRAAKSRRVLVYGANGYTAELLLPELAARNIEVVAAGRNAQRIGRIAAQFAVESRTFELTDPECVDRNIGDVAAVLNAAGPFADTAAPLIDACLRRRVDYLDLCGEVDPLAYAASMDRVARSQQVMLLPAVGFDVVPSDCLALLVANRLPNADSLMLAISPSNFISKGSANTLLRHLGVAARTRVNGSLEPMNYRIQMRWADFGQGQVPTIAVNWGDLVTAYHSTGIPNIEVYFDATWLRWNLVTINQLWGWALRTPYMVNLLRQVFDTIPGGPNAEQRQAQGAAIVAEVRRGEQAARARMVTPDAYGCSAAVAVRVLDAVVSGQRQPGFQTPARLLGPEFIMTVPGVQREVLE